MKKNAYIPLLGVHVAHARFGNPMNGVPFHSFFLNPTTHPCRLNCLNFFSGHNFGCNHNIEDVPLDQRTNSYGYGYRLEGVHRTVMSFACPSNNCPRINLFSSETGSYNSFPIGSASQNNRRMLTENAGTVSAWTACKVDCGGGGACFSGINTVHVKGRGTITMDQLQIGDYVRVGMNQYSQVYSFSHRDRNRKAEFLQIHLDGMDTASTTPLELSPDHMVFVSGVPVRGSDVKVGDILGNHKVSRIELIHRRGLYAPVTIAGEILVSGVLASNYVAILDRLPPRVLHVGSHTLTGFHRMVCWMNFDVCMKESYVDGISSFIYYAVELVKTLNTFDLFFQLAAAIFIFPFIILAFSIQQTYLPILVIMLIFWLRRSHRMMTSFKIYSCKRQ